jgi:hypothetical protein
MADLSLESFHVLMDAIISMFEEFLWENGVIFLFLRNAQKSRHG